MKIRGNTVGTPMPRSDWNQSNPKKADYIFNKPEFPDVISCEASGVNIKVFDSAARPFHKLSVYGKSVQNGTPSPDEPVDFLNIGASGVIKLYLTGKNMARFDEVKLGYWNINNGKLETDSTSRNSIKIENVLPNTKYTISSNSTISWFWYYNGSTAISIKKDSDTSKKTVTFTTPANCNTLRVTFSVGSNPFQWVQLEFGDTATAYEPAKEVQSFSFVSFDGLRGIPVATGGTYTDESGQQWICDEVDFARGVYVQRIGWIDEYAGESISAPYLSTTGELTEGAWIYYVLDTPVEIPIYEEILAEYAKLSPNKPCTCVYTDAGADLYVSYIADTKAYIDNKFNELATALVANS